MTIKKFKEFTLHLQNFRQKSKFLPKIPISAKTQRKVKTLTKKRQKIILMLKKERPIFNSNFLRQTF